MIQFPLSIFTEDEDFPFFIHYGSHEEALCMHSHKDFSELVIVLEGSAEHLVDDESYMISKGDVFVISSNTVHGYNGVENFRICNIMFRPSVIMVPDLDIAGSAGFQALFVLEPQCSRLSRFCSRLKLDINDFIYVSEIIHNIHSEYYEKKSGWKTMVKSDFLKLIVFLSRVYSFDKTEDRTGIVQIAGAVAYIEQNYTNQISVAKLAELSNYSERQFIRLFKKAFSCIPMEYITNLRMQKARELLRMSGLSITEVALRCGYNDSNYFSRIFRKYNSISPKEYRRKF